MEKIKTQLEARAYRVSNELRNSALIVLRGQRNGRRYKVPGTYRRQRDKATGRMRYGRYYTASAPGEPPAVRTGTFRRAWQPETYVFFDSYFSRIKNPIVTPGGAYILGELLEYGTSKMAKRPHHDRILEKTEDIAVRIYSEPYF